MIRISALNEESHSSGSEDDNEPTVTKEAQETIAVSEYVRALKLKTDNCKEDACNLFLELLETEVLHNVTNEKKDKLFSVKYNCYKNLGFIYIETGDSDMALKYLLNAFELDDTDVFTMNKLGQLALRMKKFEISLISFEKCLAQNPNHWPSLDGILKILCLKENYCEAYGWALLCYSKDKTYEFALNVILEVRSKFQSMGLDYIENCFKIKFTDVHLKRTSAASVFPEYVEHMEPEPMQPNFSEFRLNELTWMSTGQLIVDLYTAFEDNEWGKHTIMSFSDLISDAASTDDNDKQSVSETEPQRENVDDVANDNAPTPTPTVENNSDEDKENSNSNEGAKDNKVTLSAEGSADDSDATKQNDTNGKAKQSSRRRGSDLKFLEQWGWHKTKKAPIQRRKNVPENDGESTINGILRRILAKHFEQSFDEEPVFESENIDCSMPDPPETSSTSQPLVVTSDEFQIATQSSFDEFIAEIKKDSFNIITLLAKWLSYVSLLWNTTMPKDMLDIYLKLYPRYLNHFDLCTWNLLDKNDFKSTYRMALFYLELFHDNCASNHGREVNDQWLRLYNHIIFQSGFFDVSNDEDIMMFAETRIRVLWLQFCLNKYENDLQRAVDCVYAIDELIKERPDPLTLNFPNQKQNKKIDLDTCKELEKTFERTISLHSVNKLYHEKSFNQLITILKNTIIAQATRKSDDYDSPVRLSTQIEVFLECLWNNESFDDCLVWSEKFLKFASDTYLAAPSDTFRQTEWGDLVTYILTYIDALIHQESNEILPCLDKFYSRLIQSLSKIVVNQLDVPYDKNGVRTHPVSTMLPWTILYHILQREEDLQPVARVNTDDEHEDESLEESIPKSLMVFFTAHDFLGRHRLCTNHNGGLLLFTLDVVAPRLRAPNLEQFRDVLAEYLEQVTYCLYGYPSKKARSRHIGKHDAINIELDWQRGMQLFDIYRPDNLPEFNSYKNDSISSEHEQLLQRIVALIPSDVDPSGHTEATRNFISGTEKEIPQPFRLLPHRVHCIYYLLADYYFKNRDMVRSVKYYILDLTICPTRFDSWAGLALSKASILEVKLNSCSPFCTKEFVSESEEALRCFRQCFELKERHVLLWIEYGNFAYMMHSFYSRNLKMSSDTLSIERFEAMEMKKDECLTAASKCFNTVEEFVHRTDIEDDDQSHDEKWLYHYMLGKIAEKHKEQPDVFLDHYKKSARCLYENNASYPFRINHSNPSNLSIEALEVYYRITSSIVKYLEQHSVVKKSVGKLFHRVLKEVGNSPFALNQAKIDNNSINALKRKLSIVTESQTAKRRTVDAPTETDEVPKKLPSSESSPVQNNKVDDDVMIIDDAPQATVDIQPPTSPKSDTVAPVNAVQQSIDSAARRRSQESNVTTTTNATTTTTTGSDSSSSSTSESSSDSSSESDSMNSSDDEKNADRPLSDSEIEAIYRICIRNLEECVTRFPEHYKSIYRLANIYLHAVGKVKDLKKCRQLLIGTYTTGLSNAIQGLFTDRKLNNFFSGIWRIPSSEIDRPGSFSAHMSRCVGLLMEVLLRSSDHNILLELALNLNRNPENDKRYIKEDERKELFQQAISFCIQSFKNEISAIRDCPVDKRDDKNHLSLMIDIFKAHQKAIKHLQQKENMFATLLVDGYKVYVEGKLERLPDNVIVLDAAIKLCQCEIVIRKTNDKPGVEPINESSFLNSLKMFPSLANLSSGNAANTVPASATTVPASTTTVSTPTTTVPASTTVPVRKLSDDDVTIVETTTTTTSSTTSISTLPVPSTSSSTIATLASSSQRPRGRPPGTPGSKNSLSKSLPWTQPKMNPATLAAMLGIYGSPSLATQYSNPAEVSALLEEYYKLQASISPTSLLSAMDNIGATSMFASQQKPFTATTTASKPPKSDAKKSIATSSTVGLNQPTSTVISVGSGQLTITPSSYASSKISKSFRPHEKPLTGDSGADFDIESVIPKSELLTNKMFSEMSKTKSSGPFPHISKNVTIPKDLPKSLTITPAPPARYSSGNYVKKRDSENPHVTMHPEPKKPKKAHKRSATVPYMDFSAKPSTGLYSDVLVGYQQMINMNMMSMMSQNMVQNPMHKPAPFQQSSSKRMKTPSPSNRKSDPKLGKQLPFPIPNKQMYNAQSSALTSNSSRSFPSNSLSLLKSPPSHKSQQPAHRIDSSPIKFSATSIAAHSPHKLPPPMSRQPSPSMHQISPQKTLQQKLAEQRQKSLQQESKNQE